MNKNIFEPYLFNLTELNSKHLDINSCMSKISYLWGRPIIQYHFNQLICLKILCLIFAVSACLNAQQSIENYILLTYSTKQT
jgi:hypothetical protein